MRLWGPLCALGVLLVGMQLGLVGVPPSVRRAQRERHQPLVLRHVVSVQSVNSHPLDLGCARHAVWHTSATRQGLQLAQHVWLEGIMQQGGSLRHPTARSVLMEQ